jgi:hypothetical protein
MFALHVAKDLEMVSAPQVITEFMNYKSASRDDQRPCIMHDVQKVAIANMYAHSYSMD